jgi:hypothetical protein
VLTVNRRRQWAALTQVQRPAPSTSRGARIGVKIRVDEQGERCSENAQRRVAGYWQQPGATAEAMAGG